ncbi:hypothetical protein Poly30_50190 [Planctomycetes bacterium Poly30]|uniref:Uncharacterized protein n=1 Tax=Saltatorellus ferox TaxID=2528018 RepID=A0A518EZF4_9BACT|nr:hypothetical protein Poly30_50190 [Planctomycetes bacterium Poly30]
MSPIHRTLSLSTRALLIAASSATASFGPALAQSADLPWKASVFAPATGNTRVTATPAGTLVLENLGSSEWSGVDFRLPPAAGTGVPAEAKLEFGPWNASGALPAPGTELVMTSRGVVGGVAGQTIGTLHVSKNAAGPAQYEWDFASIGATSYTMEFWLDGTLLTVETGILGGLGTGAGPLLTPNCDADPLCCWLGAVVYIGGHWYNTYLCPLLVDVNGSQYSCNRVVVTPENPTVGVDELTGGSLFARNLPMLELSDLTLSGFDSVGSGYCVAAANSTGQPGAMMAIGSSVVSRQDLEICAHQLPLNAFGYFVVSPQQAYLVGAGGGQGNLCVGASTGRFLAQLGSTGTSGALCIQVDLNALPQPNGVVAAQPGQTWNFQCWHRDANPGATSNFTQGYSIAFE